MQDLVKAPGQEVAPWQIFNKSVVKMRNLLRYRGSDDCKKAMQWLTRAHALWHRCAWHDLLTGPFIIRRLC